jgi:hypothetical protein
MDIMANKPRHNLTVPPILHRRLQDVAEQQGTSVSQVILKCVKIGLLAFEVENTPGEELIIRGKDGAERSLLMIG